MSNRFIPVVHGATLDRPDEQDTVATAHNVAESLRRAGYRSEIIALDLELNALVHLAGQRPLAVFNLVEALGGIAARAMEALTAMDRLGLSYTGTRTASYSVSSSKLTAKAQLVAHGLPTPKYWPHGEGVLARKTVIIKSVDEHGSLGMDGGSVVSGASAVEEVRAREGRFGGRFFAEEYIDGRELNVALIETAESVHVLPIQEIDFSRLPADQAWIVDYAAKWDENSDAYHLTPRRFGLEHTEPELVRKLARIAQRAWDIFGLTGYARVDFRVASDGQPFVLEVNANPCLAPDAGFAAAAAEGGISYDSLISHIVRAAIPAAMKAA